jgi:Zn-dependent protease
MGGFALCGPTNGKVIEDLWVAVAGPLAHLPQIAFWMTLYFVLNGGHSIEFQADINLQYLKQGGWVSFWSIISVQATMMNVALFIFNLAIPAYPMDGGRCLAALLVMCGASAYTAGMATSLIAMLVGLVFMILGVYPNITFSGILLASFGAFIVNSSRELRTMAMRGQVHDHPLFDRDCYRQDTAKRSPYDTGDAIENLVSII